MTPYTDEWNKWRAGRRSKMLIERSKKRVEDQRSWPPLYLTRQGDNFRFVRWGGLQDLPLWTKR